MRSSIGIGVDYFSSIGIGMNPCPVFVLVSVLVERYRWNTDEVLKSTFLVRSDGKKTYISLSFGCGNFSLTVKICLVSSIILL